MLSNRRSYRTSLYSLRCNETSSAREDLFRLGGIAVTMNDQSDAKGAIGICLTPDHATRILGKDMWHTDKNGLQISQMREELARPATQSKRYWRTVTINDRQSFVYLSLACVRQNWERMQVNLPAPLMTGLSRELELPVWPYIELKGKGNKLLRADWRHSLPYVQVDDIVNQGNPESVAREIMRHDKPLILSRDLTGRKAYFAPLSREDVFSGRGIRKEGMSVRELRQKELKGKDGQSIRPDTMYVVTSYDDHPNSHPVPLFLLFHPEPVAPIKGIIENSYCFMPLESSPAADFKTEFCEHAVPNQVCVEAGLAIADSFRLAVENESWAGLNLRTAQGGDKFIGAIGRRRIANLLERIPLSPVPAVIGRAMPSVQYASELYGLFRGDHFLSGAPVDYWPKQNAKTLSANLRSLFVQL